MGIEHPMPKPSLAYVLKKEKRGEKKKETNPDCFKYAHCGGHKHVVWAGQDLLPNEQYMGKPSKRPQEGRQCWIPRVWGTSVWRAFFFKGMLVPRSVLFNDNCQTSISLSNNTLQFATADTSFEQRCWMKLQLAKRSHLYRAPNVEAA